jgi:hypothetical protein
VVERRSTTPFPLVRACHTNLIVPDSLLYLSRNWGACDVIWTRISADLAAVCYVMAVACGLLFANRRTHMRLWWTAGAIVLTAHVVLAYGLVHAWSHAAAVAETIERTRRATGWDVPAGIWFNFVCLLVWLADVAWWWLSPTGYERRDRTAPGRWWGWFVHAFLAFMMFNAAVVFVEGPVRIAFALATVGLIVLAVRAIQRSRQNS